MNDQQKSKVPYMTVDELLKNAVESPEIEQLFQRLEQTAAGKMLDEAQVRRQSDWSVLANQIVGAELPPK